MLNDIWKEDSQVRMIQSRNVAIKSGFITIFKFLPLAGVFAFL
jgi:hypothetical protein